MALEFASLAAEDELLVPLEVPVPVPALGPDPPEDDEPEARVPDEVEVPLPAFPAPTTVPFGP